MNFTFLYFQYIDNIYSRYKPSDWYGIRDSENKGKLNEEIKINALLLSTNEKIKQRYRTLTVMQYGIEHDCISTNLKNYQNR